MLTNVNPDDFTTARESDMDAQLMVKFFYKEREDKTQTLAEGRPIFKETEYIEIRVRGSRDPQACRPATIADKQRFPRHYEAFKKRVELPEDGTPLAEWPQISRSQIEELAFLNIKTVEQLSEAADTHISKIRMGYTLKQRAADWLKSANSTKLIADNTALKVQLKALEAKLSHLSGTMEAMARVQPAATALDAPEEQVIEAKEPVPVVRKSRRSK